MKILVADDDPQLVRALRITLAAHGYDVIAAPDGAAAVAMAAQAHPDIVLLDLGMPRLDGRAGHPGAARVDVGPDHRRIGTHRVGRQGRGLDAGADDYVTKPFQIDELLARLRALTRRAPEGEGRPSRLVRRCHNRPVREVCDPRRAHACTSPPPSGGCSSSSPATQARSSRARHSCRRCGRTESRHRLRLSAAVHVATAEEARGRPSAPAPPTHRIRHGLPPRPRRGPSVLANSAVGARRNPHHEC